jgi:hypothetical protein
VAFKYFKDFKKWQVLRTLKSVSKHWQAAQKTERKSESESSLALFYLLSEIRTVFWHEASRRSLLSLSVYFLLLPLRKKWYDRLWPQIQRSGFDSSRYQTFRKAVGLERGPFSLVGTIEELLDRKSSDSGLENREYSRRNLSHWPRGTLCWRKLALTSLKTGGYSVGIVRSRTEAMEFSFMKWYCQKRNHSRYVWQIQTIFGTLNMKMGFSVVCLSVYMCAYAPSHSADRPTDVIRIWYTIL